MLVEFKFKNYRSFKDESILSTESIYLKQYSNALIQHKKKNYLPAIAIFGKNGGGKSNVIRAFWLAVVFIKNAQRTQHDGALIPVDPFLLDDTSKNMPTEFSFVYINDGIKYWYRFLATKEKIIQEELYYAPKGKKTRIFTRDAQSYVFGEEKSKRKLISEFVAENQLFFSVACTMNDSECINAMSWFRDKIYFAQDFSDFPQQMISYSKDEMMLKAISEYAKVADVGIHEVKFEFDKKELDLDNLYDGVNDNEFKEFIEKFVKLIAKSANDNETELLFERLTAITFHEVTDVNGDKKYYSLDLNEESDGTRKLLALSPALESVLRKGGILFVDEIEKELHPILVDFIISKFQSKKTNKNGAQIIFTTHNTNLLNLETLRKDQIYLVDKKRESGVTELYSIKDFNTRTTDNIQKGYMAGKYGATPNVEIEEVE